MAYNGSIHSSTGYSPFFLMFDRELRLLLSLVLPQPDERDEVLDGEDSIHSFV
jgi:hypothetical protein